MAKRRLGRLAVRLLRFEPVAQPLSGEFACGIARETERFNDGQPEKRIPKSIEDEGEGTLGHVMGIMSEGELGDERADGVEDGVQCVPVAAEDHPRRERSCAFLAERIETLIDDHARVGFAGAGALDCLGDAAVDRVRDRLGKLALEARCRAEMVEEIGVCASDRRGHGLERDGLGALLD